MTGNGFGDIIENYVPDFELNNGKLELYEDTMIKENNNVIIADTSVESFTVEDLDEYPSRFTSRILVSKSNMLLYNNGSIQNIVFSDIPNIHLSKAILHSLVPLIYGIIAFVSVLLYLFFVALYFLTSLIYSWVGMLIQKSVGIQLPFGYLFRIAIYSKVTMLIVRTLLQMFGYSLPGKVYLSVAVTCAYMLFAILAHKNDPTLQMNQQPYGNTYNYGNNQDNNFPNQDPYTKENNDQRQNNNNDNIN